MTLITYHHHKHFQYLKQKLYIFSQYIQNCYKFLHNKFLKFWGHKHWNFQEVCQKGFSLKYILEIGFGFLIWNCVTLHYWFIELILFIETFKFADPFFLLLNEVVGGFHRGLVLSCIWNVFIIFRSATAFYVALLLTILPSSLTHI